MKNYDDKLPKVLQGRGFDYELIKDWYIHGLIDDPEGVAVPVNDDIFVTYSCIESFYMQIYGEVAGAVWMPPHQELQKGDFLYVTSNILHAFTLAHLGKKVLATIEYDNFSEKFIEENIGKKIKYQICVCSPFLMKYGKEIVEKIINMGERANLYIFESLYDHREIDKETLRQAYNRGQIFMEKRI